MSVRLFCVCKVHRCIFLLRCPFLHKTRNKYLLLNKKSINIHQNIHSLLFYNIYKQYCVNMFYRLCSHRDRSRQEFLFLIYIQKNTVWRKTKRFPKTKTFVIFTAPIQMFNFLQQDIVRDRASQDEA